MLEYNDKWKEDDFHVNDECRLNGEWFFMPHNHWINWCWM